MLNKFRNILFFTILLFGLVGCSSKSFHNDMIVKTKKSLDKKNYEDIKRSYSDSLVTEKTKSKEFISVLEDKSLADIFKRNGNIRW